MNLSSRHVLQGAIAMAVLMVAQGCVAPDGVYSEGVGVSYGADFYEPYGYEYGGWGAGYRVGPPRGGAWRPGHHSRPPAYRPAPSSRPMPSIPTHARGPAGPRNSGPRNSGGPRGR